MTEIVRMLAHFFVAGQFIGFSGSWSSGSSHQTESEVHDPSRWLAFCELELAERLAGHVAPIGSELGSVSLPICRISCEGHVGVREDDILSSTLTRSQHSTNSLSRG